MRIETVNFSLNENYEAERKTVIVIDVLRCTSVILTALENGAARVIPVRETDEALALAAATGRENCILGGERNCVRQPGFDCGNSPLEYTRERVSGKTVVITTSNGTNAICSFPCADELLIGAMRNSAAVASRAADADRDVLIVCSGTGGKPSADDMLAAGAILSAFIDTGADIELCDMSIVCVELYRSYAKGRFDLTKARHCARLISLGFGPDVEFCLQNGVSSAVPRLHDGIITL